MHARGVAAAGGEEAVDAGLARGVQVYGVHAVAEGVQAVAGHARAVRKGAGSYGGSVFVCGAGRALAVAALGREGAVGAGPARVRELAGRVRGPRRAAAARRAEAMVELGGAGQRELAWRAGRGQHNPGGAEVVSGALDAGLC